MRLNSRSRRARLLQTFDGMHTQFQLVPALLGLMASRRFFHWSPDRDRKMEVASRECELAKKAFLNRFPLREYAAGDPSPTRQKVSDRLDQIEAELGRFKQEIEAKLGRFKQELVNFDIARGR